MIRLYYDLRFTTEEVGRVIGLSESAVRVDPPCTGTGGHTVVRFRACTKCRRAELRVQCTRCSSSLARHL